MYTAPDHTIKGRGAVHNPHNRFETIEINRDEEWDPTQDPSPKTVFYKDSTRKIFSTNDSPDVGFDIGINPYRGCEHGCVYCFARPTHEYLSFSSGLDFESKIMVKENAPELLKRALQSKRYIPQVIALSGNTDCYQPVERKLKITRRCLKILLEFRNPVAIITKNSLIERDIDILSELSRYQCIKAFVSVTTCDRHLANKLEPRASTPQNRLNAIKRLNKAGVPVGVMAAPVIPAITDYQIPTILAAAEAHGAQSAGYIMLRLPYAVKDLFEDWLKRNFPERKNKVLNRVRAMRGGKLNQTEFYTRMRGEGIYADQIRQMFKKTAKRLGFPKKDFSLSTEHFKTHEKQLELY